MEEIGQHDAGRIARLLLLGLGVAVAWVVISLFSPTTSASADDSTPPEGGVLGLAQHVVHGVVGITDETVSSVGAIVPVLAPVTDVVSSTVNALDSTVAVTTDGVGAVVASTPISGVTDPVLTAVSSVVDAVPVVNQLVDATGLVPTLSAATHVVDKTVTTLVVGPARVLPPFAGTPPVVLGGPASVLAADLSAPESALPAPATPATAITQPPAWSPALLAPPIGHVQETTTPAAKTSPAPNPAPTPPAGEPGGTSAFGSGGLHTPGALLAAFSASAHAATHLTHPPSNDGVPAAPVFATDSTPD